MTIENLTERFKNSAYNSKILNEAINILNDFTLDELKAIKEHKIKQAHEAESAARKAFEESGGRIPVQSKQAKQKTDTSVKKYNGLLRCPLCGGMLYKENVCPGCAEGREGKRIRFTCENHPECTYTEAI